MKPSSLIQICLFAATFSSASALAAKEAGNGGSGMVCFTSGSIAAKVRAVQESNRRYPRNAQDPLGGVSLESIRSVKPLDLDERARPFYTREKTLRAIVNEKIGQLVESTTTLGLTVKSLWEKYPYPGPAWEEKPVSPMAVEDMEHASTSFPECVPMQVARQDWLSGRVYFTLDQRLLKRMSVPHQAAMLLHELVYAAVDAKDSRAVREIVRLLGQLGGPDHARIQKELERFTNALPLKEVVKSKIYSASKRQVKLYDSFVTTSSSDDDAKDLGTDPTEDKFEMFNLFSDRFRLNGNEFKIHTHDPRCADPMFGVATLSSYTVKTPEGRIIRGLDSLNIPSVQRDDSIVSDRDYCDGKVTLSFTESNGRAMRFILGRDTRELSFYRLTATPKVGRLDEAFAIGRGLIAPKGSLIEFHESGTVKQALLSEKSDPKAYWNLPIDFNSSVHFSANGQITAVHLASEVTQNGVVYPRGAAVSLNEKGLIVASVSVSGLLGGVILAQNSEIKFHDNGQVSGFNPARAEVFQGISNVPGSKVRFHENGKLSEIQTNSDVTIEGRVFAAKSRLYFWDNGQLCLGTLAGGGFTHQGIRTQPGSQINFAADGSLVWLEKAEGEYLGIRIQPGTGVRFYPNGVPYALQASGGTYRGLTLAGKGAAIDGWSDWSAKWERAVGTRETAVFFYPNGQLRAAVLVAGNVLAGLRTRVTPALFYPNGQLYVASFAPEQSVKLGAYPITTPSVDTQWTVKDTLVFHMNGFPLSAGLAQPVMVGGLELKEGVLTYSNGGVRLSKLAQTIAIGGKVYYADNLVALTPEGVPGELTPVSSAWVSESKAYFEELLKVKILESLPKSFQVFSFDR